MQRKEETGMHSRGEKKQSIETEPEMAQILDLADKDYKVSITCYRKSYSNN